MVVLLPGVKESEGAEGRLKSAGRPTVARSKTAPAQAHVTDPVRISKRRNKRSGVVVKFGLTVNEAQDDRFCEFFDNVSFA